MAKDDDSNSLDRRIFLGATTATLLGLPGISLAQQQKPSEPGKGSDLAAQAPSQAIADFVTGFDLKSAPPIVIERASSPSDLDWIPRGDEFYPGRESNLNSSPRLLPAAVGRSPHVGARRWRALSHRG